MTKLKHFIADESGATAIEYALIAAVIGIGLIFGMESLKTQLTNAFRRIGNTVQTNAADNR